MWQQPKHARTGREKRGALEGTALLKITACRNLSPLFLVAVILIFMGTAFKASLAVNSHVAWLARHCISSRAPLHILASLPCSMRSRTNSVKRQNTGLIVWHSYHRDPAKRLTVHARSMADLSRKACQTWKKSHACGLCLASRDVLGALCSCMILFVAATRQILLVLITQACSCLKLLVAEVEKGAETPTSSIDAPNRPKHLTLTMSWLGSKCHFPHLAGFSHLDSWHT